MTFDEWYAHRLAELEFAVLRTALVYTCRTGVRTLTSAAEYNALSEACANYRKWFNDQDTLRVAWVAAEKEATS